MATHESHRRWLRVAAVVVGSFGPVFFLGTMESSSEFARFSLDLLAWPIDGVQHYHEATTRFLSALTGGFLLGWGVLIWCLSGEIFTAAPEAVRRAVLSSVVAWFVLDSAGSIASGQPSNALFNVLVLLIVVGPLWTPARAEA